MAKDARSINMPWNCTLQIDYVQRLLVEHILRDQLCRLQRTYLLCNSYCWSWCRGVIIIFVAQVVATIIILFWVNICRWSVEDCFRICSCRHVLGMMRKKRNFGQLRFLSHNVAFFCQKSLSWQRICQRWTHVGKGWRRVRIVHLLLKGCWVYFMGKLGRHKTAILKIFNSSWSTIYHLVWIIGS